MKPVLLLMAASLWLTAPASAQTFTVIEHAVTDTVVHVASAPDNLGDVLVFANPVFDAANRTQVGTDQGYCLRVKLGSADECHWMLRLAGGQIMVEGPFYEHADSVLAVTGGTGRYVGVTGQMKLHARDAKGSEYDFVYELGRSRR